MFSSLTLRKAARLTVTTVAAGSTVAFLLLGAPADAATLLIAAGRGI